MICAAARFLLEWMQMLATSPKKYIIESPGWCGKIILDEATAAALMDKATIVSNVSLGCGHYHVILDFGLSRAGASRYMPPVMPEFFAALKAMQLPQEPSLEHRHVLLQDHVMSIPRSIGVGMSNEAVAKYITKYVRKHSVNHLLRMYIVHHLAFYPISQRKLDGMITQAHRILQDIRGGRIYYMDEGSMLSHSDIYIFLSRFSF